MGACSKNVEINVYSIILESLETTSDPQLCFYRRTEKHKFGENTSKCSEGLGSVDMFLSVGTLKEHPSECHLRMCVLFPSRSFRSEIDSHYLVSLAMGFGRVDGVLVEPMDTHHAKWYATGLGGDVSKNENMKWKKIDAPKRMQAP